GTVAISQFHALSLTRAATVAAIRAVGGLLILLVYMNTSRRNDGSARILLPIFLVSLISLSPGHSRPLGEAVAREAVFIIFLAVWMGLAGLLVRKHVNAGGRPANSPLWDAEMDP